MPPLGRVDSASLEFTEDTLTIGGETDIRTQLSAVALDGDSLWLACDEGCRLERLSRSGSRFSFAAHQVFPLDSLLALPAPSQDEADIEGLFVDEGWLWLIGSHSVKRKKPKGQSPSEIASQLRKTPRDGNRHLLARVPLVGNELKKKDGARKAATLDATDTSSALLDAIRAAGDDHLGPFLDVPGKDNGFDIEGLAAKACAYGSG